MARRLLIGIGVLATAAIAGASAENASIYTEIDLAACEQEPLDPDDPLQSGVWWCDGHGGIPVRVAEGDLRFFVSYGPGAGDEVAAGQTLPSFNTINQTLEWRLAPGLDGVARPVATILRYFTESGDGGDESQILVVTKLGGIGQVCHVGYVDALLNPDANAIARDIADTATQTFVCNRDWPLTYGLTGDDAQE